MALYQLNERPGFGEMLGTGLGSGIARSLSLLASRKLQQKTMDQQRQMTQRGLDMLQSGDPQAQSQGLSLLPEPLQLEYVKNMRQQQQQQQQELLNSQMNEQKKNMFSSLVGANVPENVAGALVNAPRGLQREMFKPLLKLNKTLDKIAPKVALAKGKQGKEDSLFALRKKLLKTIKSGEIPQDVMREQLASRGLKQEEIEVLVGTELNDNIIRYFLDKTNNNPRAARKLARKFGYKV